jgi:cell division protease FtsH
VWCRSTLLHEASHIIVDVVHNGPNDVYATLAMVGTHAGAAVRTKQPPRAGTHEDYPNMLEIILAGRVGGEILFSDGSHDAGGELGSDLERATTSAAAMASSVGLAVPTPFVFLGPSREAHGFVAFEEIRESVNIELRKDAASCRAFRERHCSAVEEVPQLLLEVGRIDGGQVAEI